VDHLELVGIQRACDRAHARVRACVCARALVCVRARLCVCARTCLGVHGR